MLLSKAAVSNRPPKPIPLSSPYRFPPSAALCAKEFSKYLLFFIGLLSIFKTYIILQNICQRKKYKLSKIYLSRSASSASTSCSFVAQLVANLTTWCSSSSLSQRSKLTCFCSSPICFMVRITNCWLVGESR